MRLHLVRRALTAGAFCAVQLTPAPTQALSSTPVLARFEGQTIDLSQGWGAARACAVVITGVTCYRSEQAMDRAQASVITAQTSTTNDVVTVAASVCSSALRLYDGASFTGTVISITTRAVGVSLSVYGFDNLTSSYKVGACAARLYSGSQTGLYGGNTAANAQSSSMLSGWDNTLSSVYIP